MDPFRNICDISRANKEENIKKMNMSINFFPWSTRYTNFCDFCNCRFRIIKSYFVVKGSIFPVSQPFFGHFVSPFLLELKNNKKQTSPLNLQYAKYFFVAVCAFWYVQKLLIFFDAICTFSFQFPYFRNFVTSFCLMLRENYKNRQKMS